MKTVKYILAITAAAFSLIACNKHVIEFPAEPADAANTAFFQITNVLPIAVNANNAIHLIELNGVQIASSEGGTTLAVNGTLPNGGSTSTARFFVAKPGANNIKFYRIKEEADGTQTRTLVYDRTVNLEAKRQNLFVFNLDQDPIVIDDMYPYPKNTSITSAANFDTDNYASIRFINFAFKGNGDTPYPGKIQYQWCHDASVGVSGRGGADGNWQNIGAPVGFGEATVRQDVEVFKETFNSGGSEQLWFRGLDEDGNVLIANDYWTTNIGVAMNHMYRGVVSGTPKAGITLYGSLR